MYLEKNKSMHNEDLESVLVVSAMSWKIIGISICLFSVILIGLCTGIHSEMPKNGIGKAYTCCGNNQITQNLNQNAFGLSGSGSGIGGLVWLPQNGINIANANGGNNGINQNLNQNALGLSGRGGGLGGFVGMPQNGINIANANGKIEGQPDQNETENGGVILGTGDVQVTLDWYANADIDLHVVDPSGEEIFYNHPTALSGGKLDVDNRCTGFVMGKPENIYWPVGGAPVGLYVVKVNYYADCSSSVTTGPVGWTITTKVKGKVSTFSGTLSSVGVTMTVTTFNV
jgi:hypothetical protein